MSRRVSHSGGSVPRRSASGHDGHVPAIVDVLLPGLGCSTPGGTAVVDEAVTRAVASAGWPGQVLPATVVTSARVYPVVRILDTARARVALGQAPELDGRVLERWEANPAGEPGAPVHVVGFIAAGRGALDRVRTMRGFGAGLVTVRQSTRWLSWEADVASTWLVRDDGVNAEVVVAGRRGPVHTARRQVGTRLIEERLFAHALACGLL